MNLYSVTLEALSLMFSLEWQNSAVLLSSINGLKAPGFGVVV